MTIRFIPRLDVKGSSLVKGINLEGLRVLGEPSIFAKYYYEYGADELIYQDVVASLHKKNTILDLIEATAKEIFVPLTVGGGVQLADDIKKILNAGADKVSINSAAIKNPEIINDFAEIFGSSTIIITIETLEIDNEYYAFTDNGRVNSGKKVTDWIEEVQLRGAGEIILTSIKNEGKGKGSNQSLFQNLKDKVNIPFLNHGGFGSLDHIETAVKNGIDGIVLSSMLHYDFLSNKMNISKVKEGNQDFLKSGEQSNRFEKISLPQIKKKLLEKGYNVRE